MKKFLSLLFLLLFLISCANPKVVNVIQPNDSGLNCADLSIEIAKANEYANEAQKAKKTGSPHNIGALLFFLPGYGITLKNVEEASTAAKNRAIHLNKLKERKNC